MTAPPKKGAAPLCDAAPNENQSNANKITDPQAACNSKLFPPAESEGK